MALGWRKVRVLWLRGGAIVLRGDGRGAGLFQTWLIKPVQVVAAEQASVVLQAHHQGIGGNNHEDVTRDLIAGTEATGDQSIAGADAFLIVVVLTRDDVSRTPVIGVEVLGVAKGILD